MDTIKCENCGEYYSVTYKRCPFCDEKPERAPAPARRKSGGGGKRLASNTKGGGYGRPRSQFMRVFALLLSLVLIVAAICIVISVVRSLFHLGGTESPTDPPVTTEQPAETPETPDAEVPSETETPDASQPSGSDTSIPEVTLATGISLSSTDITMFSAGEKAQLTAKLTPEGTSGEVFWSTSNPAVATVDNTGLVTAVAKGTANVTATMGDVSKTCIVRCNFRTTDTSSGSTTTTTPAATLSLNRSDFTLNVGETFNLTASGASGTVTWSIGNTAVATIDSNGKVTAVGSGYTTVTATASGAKATCVVRVAIP